MRKNQWADERIDLWGEVYKTLSRKIEFKSSLPKHKRVHNLAEFETVGMIIRSQRVKQGITQQGLAHSAYLSQQTISNAENGKGDLSLKTLKRIVDALNLEFDIRPKGSVTTSYTFKV